MPSVGHRTVKHGDTWEALAAELLGANTRSDVLSMANGSNPWLTPEEGAEIIVPYNLRVLVAGSNETLVTIAFKYYGEKEGPITTTSYPGTGAVYQEPFESNTARTLERLANQAVDASANRPPTVTINQGTIVNVYVSQDVDFSGVMRN